MVTRRLLKRFSSRGDMDEGAQLCIMADDRGPRSWGVSRLQMLYQCCRGQRDAPDVWIAMNGDLRRAGGISKAMSQTALKHGGTACQNIRGRCIR
jgi:hypothetical protein